MPAQGGLGVEVRVQVGTLSIPPIHTTPGTRGLALLPSSRKLWDFRARGSQEGEGDQYKSTLEQLWSQPSTPGIDGFPPESLGLEELLE